MQMLMACPTRGHVWYETAMAFAEIASLPECDDAFYIHNRVSVLEARNLILHEFLRSDHQLLLMMDDDVVPSFDILSMKAHFEDPEIGVVGSPCPMLRPGLPVTPNMYSISEQDSHYAIDLSMALDPPRGTLVDVDAIGFGCVMISRSAAESLGEFRERRSQEGEIFMSEDIDACVRARSAGYRVCADLACYSEHMVYIHAGAIAATLVNMLSSASEEGPNV